MNERLDSDSRAEAIEMLVADLEPALPLPSPEKVAAAWAGTLGLVAVGLLVATGGFRPNLVDQLSVSIPFLIEIALSLAAVIVAIVVALRLSVPGRTGPGPAALQIGSVTLLWLGTFLWSGLAPHLEHSMLGKRPGCELEVLAFGVIGSVAGLPGLRRRLPVAPRTTLAAFGLGAGLLWALLMQVGCMYEPWHGFVHHALPALSVGGIGFLAGGVALRPATAS